MTTRSIPLAVAIGAAMTAGAATASPTFYTNEAAFLAAAPATTLESFESAPTYDVEAWTFGDITVTKSGNPIPIFPGFNPSDGAKSLGINTSVLTFTRANPSAFTAFGIDVIKDVAEIGNLDIVTDKGAATVSIDGSVSNFALNRATVFFVGIIDPDGFNTVSLAPTLEGDVLEYDRLQSSALQAGVPEPAAWAMMLIGFGLAGGAIRRRRAVTA